MTAIPPILTRTRLTAVFLLVYEALFLNVVLPGHTRGAITLDGRHVAACCGDARPAGRAPAGPSRRDRDHCAVCHFAAGLTPGVPFHVAVPHPSLVGRLPPPPPAADVSLDLIPTYFACGPPPSPARV